MLFFVKHRIQAQSKMRIAIDQVCFFAIRALWCLDNEEGPKESKVCPSIPVPPPAPAPCQSPPSCALPALPRRSIPLRFRSGGLPTEGCQIARCGLRARRLLACLLSPDQSQCTSAGWPWAASPFCFPLGCACNVAEVHTFNSKINKAIFLCIAKQIFF